MRYSSSFGELSDFLNRFYQACEIGWEYIADVSDAEGINLRDFTRIDDEAFRFQLLVEILEVEICRGIIE